MGIKVKVPSAAQISELRQRFELKYAETPRGVPFHAKDLDRIRNEDIWLQRFLEMFDLDMEVSLTKLWDTCVWRQEYGTNELTEDKLNQKYLNEGSAFVHGEDIDGKPLLIFRVRLHNRSKNLDDLIRIVVYWVERTQREQHMIQLTVLFDMSGTGLATMDLDFVKRIVETFKLYYPNTLNYILVYELAWVLNAAFKVVKALLPPKAVEILKMISKKDITQYVPKQHCLISWGGSNNYEFSFQPERKPVPAHKTSTNGPQMQVQPANAGDEEPHKKVHFANSSPMVIQDYVEQQSLENMLAVEPSDFLSFDAQDVETIVTITCTAKIPVTYKIQTTSPEKFRVRPRCGVLAPNESAQVGIWLKSEHSVSDESRDKFLIMGMAAVINKDSSLDNASEMWKDKHTSGPGVEHHRLVCCVQPKNSSALGSIKQSTSTTNYVHSKTKAMEEMPFNIEQELKRTQKLQYAIIVAVIFLTIVVGFMLYEQRSMKTTTCDISSKGNAFKCSSAK